MKRAKICRIKKNSKGKRTALKKFKIKLRKHQVKMENICKI